ncbi:MAG: sulfatase-like hydrolase/transferase [Phycisphaerales bacterium]|nr:sulfatase-like hydrolase/transferase [Phycisphaerales bacterium]
MSALGHPVIKTPHFDQLIQGGAIFTRAYSHVPLCVPSRTNLWTGLPAHETGCIRQQIPYSLRHALPAGILHRCPLVHGFLWKAAF